MIEIWDRGQIEDKIWDDFISSTPQRVIYAMSWYLDAMPQTWGALVFLDDGRALCGAIPYQLNRTFGVKKIEQNAFSNELGIFHLASCDTADLFKKFIMSHRFISRYTFNASNQFSFLQHYDASQTHHLALNQNITDLRKNYSENRRRSLKKAENASLQIVEQENISSLIELFHENVAHKIYGIQEAQYDVLEKLYLRLNDRNLTKLFEVRSSSQEILSAALFVKSFDRWIYFFAASSKKGLEHNSQTLLINHVINLWAESPMILDFEGGATNDLARFYTSFGAKPIKLYHFRKMPYLVKYLSLIRKRLA